LLFVAAALCCTMQMLLDRSGCGVVSAPDLLAAADVAVHWHAGICPMPRVDVNDVLLQLVLQLQQQQEQEQKQQSRPGQAAAKHKHKFVSLMSPQPSGSHACRAREPSRLATEDAVVQTRNTAVQPSAAACAQARLLFQRLDEGGSGRLGAAELGKLFKQALPGLQQRDIT
jgi:hypothetical protein